MLSLVASSGSLSLQLGSNQDRYGYNSHMIRASVSHTKNHLSALLAQVKAGETVLITDRDRPIARIVPMEESSWTDRVEEMARYGLVRLPTREPLSVHEIQTVTLSSGRNAGVLDALLEERGEGR